MKKINIFLLSLFFVGQAFAGTVSVPTTYAPTGQVTSTNLNGNFSAILATLNGGLDNTNADTVNGYRFFEVKASLPSAGTQGRVIYLTSDNTLNFDTGASFTKFHETPVGTVVMWPTNSAPTDYLICDGSAVSRALYSALYAVIGTTYGSGDGSSTFNLPDFQGLMPVGRKAADANFDILKTPTTYVGEKTHTLIIAEMPAHAHKMQKPNSNLAAGGGGVGNELTVNWGAGADNSRSTETIGGGGAHNTMPPYIVINFAIKYR